MIHNLLAASGYSPAQAAGGSRERSRTNSFTGSLASSLGLSQRGSIIELAREARELARDYGESYGSDPAYSEYIRSE